MGIKSFSKFLDEYAADAVRPINIQHMSGTTISVDVSLFMHKFSYQIGSTISDCVQKFLAMHFRFTLHDIKAIYVFDGKPPAEKARVLIKRARRNERLRTMGNQRNRVTQEHYHTLKQVFKREGINFLCATNDAEKTCAWLCKCTIADAVFTDDYDSLAFGAPIMVRGGNKQTMHLIDRNKILDVTGFTESDFTNFCLLCGSEYTPSHLRYGYKKAAALVKQLRTNAELQNLAKKFSLHITAPPVRNANCKYFAAYVIRRVVMLCLLLSCKENVHIGNGHLGDDTLSSFHTHTFVHTL